MPRTTDFIIRGIEVLVNSNHPGTAGLCLKIRRVLGLPITIEEGLQRDRH